MSQARYIPPSVSTRVAVWGASQEHLSRKCADLFSEPQLGRKCGRNASSLSLARPTCRSSRTATLPTGRLAVEREAEIVTLTEEGKKEKPILERSSDCTVHLSLATDLFLRTSACVPRDICRLRQFHEEPTFFSKPCYSAEVWRRSCHAEKTCLGC